MKVLVDTDALFGLLVETDANHIKAKKILKKSFEDGDEVVVLNLVMQETATVLSHKADQKTALIFVKNFPSLGMKVLEVDKELEKMGWETFGRQTKNKTSFVDCVNLAAINKYKFDGIVGFDEFYPSYLK